MSVRHEERIWAKIRLQKTVRTCKKKDPLTLSLNDHLGNIVPGPIPATVVREVDPIAEAVLIRGGVVVEGLEVVRARRGSRVESRSLTDGPGKLCQALAIDRRFDGHGSRIGGSAHRRR